MRLTIVNLLCLVLVMIGPSTPAAADLFVGLVKSVEGGAVITRNGETITIVTGLEIKQADILKSGSQGAVGLIFSDDTRISMGPNTEIAVDDYLFEP
jgi:hypothetical protein